MFTNPKLGTALLVCAGVALASCTTMVTGTDRNAVFPRS